MTEDTEAVAALLDENEAAKYLRLSPRTLQKKRGTTIGPVYVKLGGRVLYAISDLNDWIASCRRSNTSGTGKEAA